jgi:glycosyltransferase involved in cell wall biosynthesis
MYDNGKETTIGLSPSGHTEQTSVDGGPFSPPIIVHCHLRWDFVWQRPQQIFSRLAVDHPILFTEEPMVGGTEPRLMISEPQSNLVRAVPVLPSETHTNVDLECETSLQLLRRALKEHPLLAGRFDAPVQWFYSPMTAPCFADQFGALSIVYDCMDELANFRFASPDIKQREEFLLSRADLVFTGGYHLFESKSRHHANVHFYGCGVDADHYSQARLSATTIPAEIATLPRPIFGYIGVIDERLDYDLLTKIAQKFSQGSVVMIGPLAKVERHMLPNLPNIYWFGQRPYRDLPALLKSFDVCLMPFALNEATRYINPTKTLEYMAAGKPIVSTAVPDVVRNFTPVVEIGRSHEDFVHAVARAYQSPDPGRINQGIDRATGASWEAIVSAMRGHMLKTVSRFAELGAQARRSAFP